MRLIPAGHEQTAKIKHARSRDDLLELCLNTLEKTVTALGVEQQQYERYVQRVAGLTVTADEANALAIDPVLQRDPRYTGVGLFISALHNTCVKSNIIIYDVDSPVCYLGFQSKKLFVNRGSCNKEAFQHAHGVSVNLGSIGSLGYGGCGLLLEYGPIERRIFIKEEVKKELVSISQNQAMIYNTRDLLDIFSDKKTEQELIAYGAEIAAVCRGSEEDITATYTKDPVSHIMAKVRSIIGYDPREERL